MGTGRAPHALRSGTVLLHGTYVRM